MYSFECRYDLLELCTSGPKEKLDSTVISQVLFGPALEFLLYKLDCLGNNLLMLKTVVLRIGVVVLDF